MRTNLMRFFVIALLFLGVTGNVYASVEEELSAMVQHQYTPQEFQEVLNIIKYYHPQYSRDKIGHLIVMAYYKLQEHLRNISLYEVALGIKSHSRGQLGVDLQDQIVTYLNAQIKNSPQR